jgi:hypothetical protein
MLPLTAGASLFKRCEIALHREGRVKALRGRLAQLVERLLYTQDVGGSIPSPPTKIPAFKEDARDKAFKNSVPIAAPTLALAGTDDAARGSSV